MKTLKELTSSNGLSISNCSMFYSSSELIATMQKYLCALPQFYHQITLKTHINNIKDFNMNFSLSKENYNNNDDQNTRQRTQKYNDKKVNKKVKVQ